HGRVAHDAVRTAVVGGSQRGLGLRQHPAGALAPRARLTPRDLRIARGRRADRPPPRRVPRRRAGDGPLARALLERPGRPASVAPGLIANVSPLPVRARAGVTALSPPTPASVRARRRLPPCCLPALTAIILQRGARKQMPRSDRCGKREWPRSWSYRTHERRQGRRALPGRGRALAETPRFASSPSLQRKAG